MVCKVYLTFGKKERAHAQMKNVKPFTHIATLVLLIAIMPPASAGPIIKEPALSVLFIALNLSLSSSFTSFVMR